jgi:hypothetical protein
VEEVFSRRNHLHALICTRDCAAGHRGVGSRAGRCFDPVPGQDARRFRRDPDAADKTKAHADRETVSERDNQTTRQRHPGADRDRHAFPRAERNRDPHPGPFAVRSPFADDRCVPNPNSACGPNRDCDGSCGSQRHFNRETTDHLSDGKAAGYFNRETDGHLHRAPDGDLDTAAGLDSFCDRCAETIRYRYVDAETDTDRHGQSFADSDAEAKPIAKTAEANPIAETDSHSQSEAVTNSEAHAHSSRATRGG